MLADLSSSAAENRGSGSLRSHLLVTYMWVFIAGNRPDVAYYMPIGPKMAAFEAWATTTIAILASRGEDGQVSADYQHERAIRELVAPVDLQGRTAASRLELACSMRSNAAPTGAANRIPLFHAKHLVGLGRPSEDFPDSVRLGPAQSLGRDEQAEGE